MKKNMMSKQLNIKYIVVASVLAAVLLFAARGFFRDLGEKTESDFFKLGTVARVTVWTKDGAESESMISAAAHEAERLERLLSANIAASDIGKVNDPRGKAPIAVSKETYELVERSVAWARETEGAFDPSIGAIVKLWAIGTPAERVPSKERIEKLLPFSDYREIKLHVKDGKYFVNVPHALHLDLGGIAKGYIADRMAALLKSRGASSAVIDLGGNVLVFGPSPKKKGWRIGIQWPFRERGEYFGIYYANDESVVTSGAYERYFTYGGKMYHHIFDAFTGYPAATDLLSATVMAENSADADAVSTALFVMGFEKAKEFLQSHREFEAILCKGDAKSPQLFVTPGAKGNFKAVKGVSEPELLFGGDGD